MKRSKEFRKWQQIVMTKQKRGLSLKNSLEIKMAEYIEQSQLKKAELDELASEIEDGLKN